MKKSLIFILLLVYLIGNQTGAQNSRKDLTLKDIWGGRSFLPQSPKQLQSLNDGEHYCILENDTLFEYEYQTGKKTRMIFTANELIRPGKKDTIKMSSFLFSRDESKILVSSDVEQIYRYSSTANYYVFDLKTKHIEAVSENGKQRLGELSPDGQKVAFIRDNNLFIKDFQSGKEEQLTRDGQQNNVINGASDWVYEEEFKFSKAFFWSPDGSMLAFYRFDESKVKEYTMTKWGDLYPEEYKYKYPKAGEANSVVSIHVYDIRSGAMKTMDIGQESDQYIPRIKWTASPAILCIYRMNRLQNKLELLFGDVNNGETHVVYTEENKSYIEINDDITFTNDNNFFFLTSEKDGWRHIYLYGIHGRLMRQLTFGNWEVASIIGYDQVKRIIYFTSTENGPLDRDIYSITLDGTRKRKLSKLTCWNNVSFSKNFKYYTATNSTINSPPVYTVNVTRGKELRVLEDNTKLVEKVKDYQFQKTSFFSFTTTGGVSLNGLMMKPRDFDSTKKYPVLMSVYGGPGSQTVQNRYGGADYLWDQMLAEKGYIIVSVDNRGTGGRGEEFTKCTYKNLGKYETEDQIEAAQYLAKLPYVDAKRIGIWGWSYGGFMAALCITRGADVFKAAIAVAPVTNWRYYDNIYTERYMRTPKENPVGYDENSPITYAKELKGKFLLVHGTLDDNVHFQNSMEFVAALLKENKQFETFFYPNKNHNISGGNTRLNLYQKMTDFILNNL